MSRKVGIRKYFKINFTIIICFDTNQ